MLLALFVFTGHAAEIINPGFENDWQGWIEVDKDDKSVSLSGNSHEGAKAASISSQAGTFAQVVAVKANTDYVASAWVMGTGIVGVKIGQQLVFERQGKTKTWKQVQVAFNSGEHQQVAVFAQFNGKKNLFDDFSISQEKGERNDATLRVAKGGLSPDLPPGRNFDLTDWNLNTPEDSGDGRSKRISERELAGGYQNKAYFHTAEDGGMIFRTTIEGKKTSKNTKYTRTELREMLRRGDTSISTKSDNGSNKNNWVFSSAPRKAQKLSGGVDGTLRATLAVNHVTTTGRARDIGTVIIGQIHASSDEPVRLHYRKLPQNERGSIYVAHEISGGDDQWHEILGSRSDTAKNPLDGIALNEKFSYEIAARGHELKISIIRDGLILGSSTIDMTHSGYDVTNDYMYFKAGVYTQNDSGDPQDYDQATFYALENKHQGYDY